MQAGGCLGAYGIAAECLPARISSPASLNAHPLDPSCSALSCPPPAVFVPVGGGGLISGIAAVLKAADPSIHMVGCQPAASDVMRQSVEAGRVVAAEWRPTLSEGTVGGIEEGAVTLEPCCLWVDEWVTVEEEEIAAAVLDTLTHTAMQVEGEWGSKTAGVGAVPLPPLCMAGCPSPKQPPLQQLATRTHLHPPSPSRTSLLLQAPRELPLRRSTSWRPACATSTA